MMVSQSSQFLLSTLVKLVRLENKIYIQILQNISILIWYSISKESELFYCMKKEQ